MDRMCAASDSLRSYLWVRLGLPYKSGLLPSSSLETAAVLRALGDQPYCALGEQNFLDDCSGMSYRTSMSHES